MPVDKVLIVFTLTGTLQTVGVTFFGFPELIMSVSFTALGIPAALSVSVTLLDEGCEPLVPPRRFLRCVAMGRNKNYA